MKTKRKTWWKKFIHDTKSSLIYFIYWICCLALLDPPEITRISGNQTVDEGDVVILNCIAGGEPKPNITWKRLSDNSHVNFPLTITGKKDEGSYRCTAENGIGNISISDVNIAVQSK